MLNHVVQTGTTVAETVNYALLMQTFQNKLHASICVCKEKLPK